MRLRHKGAHPQGEAQPRGAFLKAQQQRCGAFHIVVVFTGKSHHSVELQGLEASLLGMAGGGFDFFAAELFVHHAAHALAAAFDRDGEGFAASSCQHSRQLRSDRCGPHGTDADA